MQFILLFLFLQDLIRIFYILYVNYIYYVEILSTCFCDYYVAVTTREVVNSERRSSGALRIFGVTGHLFARIHRHS